MAKWHQKKEVNEAIEYALQRGFRLRKGAHAAYVLLCPLATRDGEWMSINSTPRVSRDHADAIVKFVDNCPHWTRPP